MSKQGKKPGNKGSNKNLSPGQLLRQARDEHKLSVEVVAERMHLGVDVVRALENSEYGKLPAPTYIRGYLRSYAAIVGVDGDKLVEEYNQIVGEQPPELVLDAIPQVARPDRKPGANIVILSGLVVTSLLVLIIWLSSGEDPQMDVTEAQPVQQQAQAQEQQVAAQEQAVDTIALNERAEVVTEPAAKLPDSGAPVAVGTETESRDSDVTGEVTEPAPEPAMLTEPAPAPAVSVPVVPAAVETTTAVATQHSMRLSLAFDGTSWVEVYDANQKRLMMRLAKAGSRYNLTGLPPLHVLLGNAPVVRLKVNDQDFSHQAFIRGKVARFDIPAAAE